MDEKEQKQLLMDLDVVMRSNDCQFIVRFYGALFKEVGYTNLHSARYLCQIGYVFIGVNLTLSLRFVC